jgi:hypothetical protein
MNTMTTHRVLQLSQLLESAEELAAKCARGASNLTRIGNHKGAAFQLRRSVRAARIARIVRQRLEKDESAVRRARWLEMSEGCSARRSPKLERRPGNALNIEIGQPAPRCIERLPKHWPAGSSALRWIGSGGDVLVFGLCAFGPCPRRAQ